MTNCRFCQELLKYVHFEGMHSRRFEHSFIVNVTEQVVFLKVALRPYSAHRILSYLPAYLCSEAAIFLIPEDTSKNIPNMACRQAFWDQKKNNFLKSSFYNSWKQC